MSPQSVLNQQFELYGQQAEQFESWKLEHEKAMASYDLEDILAVGLTLLDRLNRHAHQRAQQVLAGEIGFNWETSRLLANGYKGWLAGSTHLLHAIDECEDEGFYVQDATTMRQAHAKVSAMCLNMDRAEAGYHAMERGEGVPAEQVMNELRSRLSE